MLQVWVGHEREALDLRHGRGPCFDPRAHTGLPAAALDLREEGEVDILLVGKVLQRAAPNEREPPRWHPRIVGATRAVLPRACQGSTASHTAGAAGVSRTALK
eukprot:1469203-Prymnesium_polylepis.2